MSDIKKRIEINGFVINRVPEKTKHLFRSLAEQEFENDYGMCLRQILIDSFEYNRLKEMFFENNLNVKLLFDTPEKNVEEEKPLTNLKGEPIKKRRSK